MFHTAKEDRLRVGTNTKLLQEKEQSIVKRVGQEYALVRLCVAASLRSPHRNHVADRNQKYHVGRASHILNAG